VIVLGRTAHAAPPMPELEAAALRAEVRGFLDEARRDGVFAPRCNAWMSGFSPQFSRELARRGWIGMTWPARYGGHERSAVDRHVVCEELLAAGAPVAAHWFADRQSGPQIYSHGSERLRTELLPHIAAGTCFFSIAMSEPDSGSDLASVRTRARRVNGGWRLTGRKLWTSHAHRSHFASVLCRTAETDDRHLGLSVMVVDLSADGVRINPIESISGEREWGELVLDDVDVPHWRVLGDPGDGWRLVTAELALERSGPERFLSTFPLLGELVASLRPELHAHCAAEIGSLVAELSTLRRMSLGVAVRLEQGRDLTVEAALVKDRGTQFERRTVEVARSLIAGECALAGRTDLVRLLEEAVLAAPGFTLRGGTTEILRGIVARQLVTK
jgi:alkylation response protein AidB-like acyl-CoA dehydrogenase